MKRPASSGTCRTSTACDSASSANRCTSGSRPFNQPAEARSRDPASQVATSRPSSGSSRSAAILGDDADQIQRARERDVQPHLALGVRDAAEVGDDHGRPLESLEAQECVADDRVGDFRVVRRHDVMRPQS